MLERWFGRQSEMNRCLDRDGKRLPRWVGDAKRDTGSRRPGSVESQGQRAQAETVRTYLIERYPGHCLYLTGNPIAR